MAATINVGGTCTLVRAINAANKDTRANGRCAKSSGADTIVLPRGSTQRLTSVNNDDNGLPVIRSDITIVGNNSTIRRAPTAPRFRIFAVGDTGDLTLRRTTVSGGRGVGGGVYIYGGSVSLTNSTISGNNVERNANGGDVGNEYGVGGSLTVTNSTISNNFGTGIQLHDGRVSLTNSTVSNNIAGCGVFADVLTVIDSTISGNGGCGLGAGLGSNPSASLTVNRSTISGNGGAGVAVFGSFSATLLAKLTNTTISGNGTWGVIANGGTNVRLTNTTVTGNGTSGFIGAGVNINQGTVTLTRTLISGNTNPRADGAEVYNRGGSDSVTAASFNVFGHSGLTNDQAFENFTPGPTDITATSNGNDPTALAEILDTGLANNGGPTRTHALVFGSPAIDTVTDGTCPPPAKDQRGVRRPQDGNNDGAAICDTGSFERR
ncbi:MAG TPA: right-handed parallel beta-helix repeat-containing protein [Gammaproteobacteria bacterium]|nr:right-handed parallel beta-helix repeat-containing protein [Gammaproteobacteria bacterium]